jgi:ferric-dicitrate binding protein FerR (iron transport regulator)
VTELNDSHLEELFVRYWDDALTQTEAADLQERLASDPACRECFQHFCLQTLAAAELQAVPHSLSRARQPLESPMSRSAGWTRRKVLAYLGSGAVAATAAAFAGWRFWAEDSSRLVRVRETTGDVTMRTAESEVPASGFLTPGASILTHGPVSSAVLTCPDGTDVTFTGDSLVTLAKDGRRLLLRRGAATANIPTRPVDAFPLALATTEAMVKGLSGVVMTFARLREQTEVGVERGQVTVAALTGQTMAKVSEGQLLTVRADGASHLEPMQATPEEYAWDLARPLPNGWHVGYLDLTPEGPVVRPEFWYDPYHHAQMSQIRSDGQWACGFFSLWPDSVIRVRYWIDRPGPSQVCFCVRTSRPAEPATGMLECNGAFAQARPGEWQWLEVRAGEMLDNIHTPRFTAPWVGFLVIMNTYEVDLGLKVAEFRVSRPGRQAAGS